MAKETQWLERLEYLEPGGEGSDLMLASPPRLLRASLYLMAGLLFAALIWSWLSKVDIYITSIGAVRPKGDLVKVQAIAAGRITKVEVKDGQAVSEGDVLFVLDQTALDQVRNELEGTRERRLARERSQIALAGEHQAQAASDRIAVENAEVGLVRAREQQRALAAAVEEAEEILKASRLDLDRKETLFREGVVSDAEQRSAMTQLRIAESSKRSAEADLEASRQSVASAKKNASLLERQAVVGVRERERQAEAISSEVGQLRERETSLELEVGRLQDGLEIRSPVDGVITTVGARNVGEVTQVGMVMATIAPEEAPWIVESLVSNRDAGPLRENLGARVKLKFDAFPFRDYGTLNGKLVEVSPDAESTILGDAYRVRITMDALELSRGRREGEVRLGMTVVAEIVKEEERILMLLFRKVRDRISYE